MEQIIKLFHGANYKLLHTEQIINYFNVANYKL